MSSVGLRWGTLRASLSGTFCRKPLLGVWRWGWLSKLSLCCCFLTCCWLSKWHDLRTDNLNAAMSLKSSIKRWEKIITFLILAVTECNLDPLQFAYQSGRGVDDAKLFILNTSYRHLEGPQTRARTLFAEFSSAFNTIQPHILANKPVWYFSLDSHLVLWIIGFLTSRSQRFFVSGCFLELLLTCTGSPQGCVLSPLFYILYTDDCRSNHLNRFLLRFADDSALLSLLHGSEQYVPCTRFNWVCWLVRQLLFRSKCDWNQGADCWF